MNRKGIYEPLVIHVLNAYEENDVYIIDIILEKLVEYKSMYMTNSNDEELDNLVNNNIDSFENVTITKDLFHQIRDGNIVSMNWKQVKDLLDNKSLANDIEILQNKIEFLPIHKDQLIWDFNGLDFDGGVENNNGNGGNDDSGNSIRDSVIDEFDSYINDINRRKVEIFDALEKLCNLKSDMFNHENIALDRTRSEILSSMYQMEIGRISEYIKKIIVDQMLNIIKVNSLPTDCDFLSKNLYSFSISNYIVERVDVMVGQKFEDDIRNKLDCIEHICDKNIEMGIYTCIDYMRVCVYEISGRIITPDRLKSLNEDIVKDFSEKLIEWKSKRIR